MVPAGGVEGGLEALDAGDVRHVLGRLSWPTALTTVGLQGLLGAAGAGELGVQVIVDSSSSTAVTSVSKRMRPQPQPSACVRK